MVRCSQFGANQADMEGYIGHDLGIDKTKSLCFAIRRVLVPTEHYTQLPTLTVCGFDSVTLQLAVDVVHHSIWRMQVSEGILF